MLRVLLADDSPHAQRMGREILEPEGFEILGITDGADVFQTIAQFPPDVILADVALPGCSGYELCAAVRRTPALGHVKVLLLASDADPVDDAEARRAGADGVVEKPLEPSDLVETVRAVLARPPAPAGQGALASAVEQALEGSGPAIDPGLVRAAVFLALESALPNLLDEITRRVVDALRRDTP